MLGLWDTHIADFIKIRDYLKEIIIIISYKNRRLFEKSSPLHVSKPPVLRLTHYTQTLLQLFCWRHWPESQRKKWFELTWDTHMAANLALLASGYRSAIEVDCHNLFWFCFLVFSNGKKGKNPTNYFLLRVSSTFQLQYFQIEFM